MRTLKICGIILFAAGGCGRSSEPPCEEGQYTRAEVQRAVRAAIAELQKKGTPIDSSAWENPDFFESLAQATASKLGCAFSEGPATAMLTESARRHGDNGGCAAVEVDESYDNTIGYCGPDAVRGEDCTVWSLRYPGECLNRVCHRHDRCYGMTEIPVLSVGDAELNACLWSDITAACDAAFFEGFEDCLAEGFLTCGVSCMIVAAIADELRELSRDTGVNAICVECLASGACEAEEEEAEAEEENLCGDVVPLPNPEFESSLEGWTTTDPATGGCSWSSEYGGSAECLTICGVGNATMTTSLLRVVKPGERIIVHYEGVDFGEENFSTDYGRFTVALEQTGGGWGRVCAGSYNGGADCAYTFMRSIPMGTRIQLQGGVLRFSNGCGFIPQLRFWITEIRWQCP